MLAPTSLVAVLLLASSVVSAAGGLSPHQAGVNRRRHSAKNIARRGEASTPPTSDIQRPGTVQMRKRADGKNCKVRPSASGSSSSVAAVAATSAVATTSVAQAAATSAAPVVVSSSAVSAAASTTKAYVAPTTTAAAPVAPTTTKGTTAAAATTTAASSGSTSGTALTPNGNKAGVAGMDSLPFIKQKLGWWYDWNVVPNSYGTDVSNLVGVNMLWGAGTADSTDASRLSTFKSLTTTPKYLLGPNEPDCSAGGGSAGLTVAATATLWNTLIAPMGEKGALLGSPAMCKQAAESFLSPFSKQISRPWDITTVHINKNNMDGVRKDLDHYAQYGKPMWVTEFACVDDSSSFIPCTDQNEINTYINDIVDLLEADSRVYAYAYSDGMGLGDVWPTVKNGKLSASGQTYLNAISKYH